MTRVSSKRVYTYWKSLKRDREYQHGYRQKGWYRKPTMMTAMKFGIPIREVKDIIQSQQLEA